jgi:homoserine kinase type II
VQRRRRRAAADEGGMAVYTEVTDEALNAFLADYDLGRTLSFKGIAEGVENSNYLLRTDAGPFILTLYEKRVREDDLPFFLGLMEHLATHGVICPLPVHSKRGVALGRLSGRAATIVTFLEGLWIRRPKVLHCAEVGEALAKMHQAGRGFSLRRDNALALKGWPPLFETARERAHEVSPGLAEETAAELAFLQANWPGDLPEGVVHADLFPDNVFFLGEKLSGLIDFYFACNDAFAYDLSVCLNAWCFELDGEFNISKGAAMIAAYQRVRKLEPGEVKALPILARGSALRFMLTRLVDWLNVPSGALVKPKDPREYLGKLRFHQKAKSAADYGFRP